MHASKLSSAVLLALMAAAGLSAQSEPLPRLRVSENGRFFVKEGGAPFFYLGDTAWCVFTRPTHEAVDQYLKDRASKGFTAIQGVLLIWDGLTRANPLGQTLLVDKSGAKINEAFFDNVDYIVNKAESLGMYTLILPIWSKGMLGGERSVFDETTGYNYCKLIGARYRNKPVIWMLGGDRPGAGMEEITRAMARGLTEGGGGTRMISYHPTGRQSSSMWFHNESWLDFNSIQSGHSSQNKNYELVASDYQLKPAKPVIDAESGYENITDGLRQAEPGIKRLGAWDVRRYGYLSVFAGAAGFAYGMRRSLRVLDARDAADPLDGGIALAGIDETSRLVANEVREKPDGIPADAGSHPGSIDAGERPQGYHGPHPGDAGLGRELRVCLQRLRARDRGTPGFHGGKGHPGVVVRSSDRGGEGDRTISENRHARV